MAASVLTREQRQALLDVARQAIREHLARGRAFRPEHGDPALDVPAGAFVSLHVDGNLRGCIGNLYDQEPAAQTVSRMAVEAATRDPRFPELRVDELRRVDIEISVLGPLVRLAPEDVVVGTHGLYVVSEHRRGVLLPQVAVDHGWSRERFLSETCRKAGLAADAWQGSDVKLFGFEAQVFSDGSMLDER